MKMLVVYNYINKNHKPKHKIISWNIWKIQICYENFKFNCNPKWGYINLWMSLIREVRLFVNWVVGCMTTAFALLLHGKLCWIGVRCCTAKFAWQLHWMRMEPEWRLRIMTKVGNAIMENGGSGKLEKLLEETHGSLEKRIRMSVF